MKNELFTIIITNYNQEKYIFDAINSVLEQTYSNIELIITDDCSKKFDQAKITRYIEENSNINFEFVVNEENLGTVKTLNKALKRVKGEFFLFFAADDELQNKNVVNNFIKAFKKNKNDIISSICLLCDNKMEQIIDKFPHKKNIEKFNQKSALKQNRMLKLGPIFAPGATAYRSNIMKKINYLDENYFLIEDWPTFLKLTRLKNKIYIANFISMKHRGGGVSEEMKLAKETIIKILKDTDRTYRKEVFISFKKLSLEEKLQILDRYQRFSYAYGFKYWPIYFKYYSLIFTNLDVLLHKLSYSKTVVFKIFLPIVSCMLAGILFLLLNNVYILIFGSVLIYLFLRVIISQIFYRRIRNEKK